MIENEFQGLKNRFNDYVNSFRSSSGILHPMMQLKLDHSARVATEARDIAAELGWSENDILLAEAIGLFHDVGRFSQYQEFKTYYDPKSVNHGERGYDVLIESGWLDGLAVEERDYILESVHYHNCHTVPDDLSHDSNRFVKLVRDADKLDIFFVLNNAIKEDSLKNEPGIIWNLPRDVPPSSMILDDLRNRRQASYEHVKSQADFCLLQLCWIYDLNYVPTIRKVAAREIVDRIAATLPTGVELYDAVRHLKDFLRETI
ncbi:MAG: HD domain-containing protein [Candidatus Riflebacteria bacterium]|jgi:putative nucleotidyltransferase with HDIG domain|nr:HD domain-containing protein [Candidatus Riflebacteria bacterium]